MIHSRIAGHGIASTGNANAAGAVTACDHVSLQQSNNKNYKFLDNKQNNFICRSLDFI